MPAMLFLQPGIFSGAIYRLFWQKIVVLTYGKVILDFEEVCSDRQHYDKSVTGTTKFIK